ncbi:MAG TPA: SDR family NAD(P)-dependent oxidoreductase [Vicinamibacterales bacterium]|jgi:3-hydroxybutyrate dehydrogenase|nr:SDR family NAD(P)-dependent oxidoreductase [Vicinamibacterales bacterium]
MNRPLSGRRALVTGSTRGLGLATVRRLAADGCDVVVHGLGDAEALETLRSGLERDHGVRVLSSGANLVNPADIANLITAAISELGGIDILVNNAVTRHTAPVEEFTPEQWDESILVNLSSAFHTTRLLVPGMKQQGWGRIVNVSSIYGLRGAVNRVGYVTSKTGLIGLTRAIALETAKSGITCNAVCPGTSESPTHEDAIARLSATADLSRDTAEARVLAGKQPTGRLIAERGVAALIAFLCTDDATDITGAVLPIDGAWSAG